jgi:hypothetical protein
VTFFMDRLGITKLQVPHQRLWLMTMSARHRMPFLWHFSNLGPAWLATPRRWRTQWFFSPVENPVCLGECHVPDIVGGSERDRFHVFRWVKSLGRICFIKRPSAVHLHPSTQAFPSSKPQIFQSLLWSILRAIQVEELRGQISLATGKQSQVLKESATWLSLTSVVLVTSPALKCPSLRALVTSVFQV